MTFDFNHNVHVSADPALVSLIKKLGEKIMSKVSDVASEISAKIESEGQEIRDAVMAAVSTAIKSATDPLVTEIQDLKDKLANAGVSDADLESLKALIPRIDGLSDAVAGAVSTTPSEPTTPETPTEPTNPGEGTGEFPAPTDTIEAI